MSYLVDALKKAERERYAQQGSDMRAVSVSHTAAAGGTASRVLIWAVVSLVAFNLGLLVYLLGPARASDSAHGQPAKPRPATKTAAARPAGHAKTAPTGQGALAGGPVTASPKTVTASPKTAEASLKTAKASKIFRGGVSAPSDSRSRAKPGGHGSMTFSSTPLTGPSTNTHSTRAPAGANAVKTRPKITINGQLYSRVPGRSFILVNGQRYHEGQRLASGPAVESIGHSGATLIYQGQRYHVPGP